MIRAAVATALLALASAALAAPVGWRRDGSGASPDAVLPASWPEAATVWTVRLPSWSNGSVVAAGDRVLVASEPDQLTCLDARDGHVRWSTRLSPVDGIPAAEREPVLRSLAQADADEARLKAARASYALLQREVRAGTGDAGALERLGAEISTLQARVATAADYRPRGDLGMVGATTPTPVVDGERIYALSGNGVLAALDLDGRRLWTRWLGPPVRPMRGWFVGHASSPQLVDGVLVVPYGRLRGIDPATGRELWASGPPWDSYGTPAVARPGGLPVVVTPLGDVVRVRDGVVVASGLGALFHVGPLVVGDTVVLIGNVDASGHGVTGTGSRLAREGDGVRVTRLWSRTFPDGRNVGAGPVVLGGKLWLVDLFGTVRVVDVATGAQVTAAPVGPDLGSVYASPVLAGDRLLVTGDKGLVAVLQLDPAGRWTVLGTSQVPTSRSTPWLQGRRAYFRGTGELRCVEVR